jgi:hypothetical protein
MPPGTCDARHAAYTCAAGNRQRHLEQIARPRVIHLGQSVLICSGPAISLHRREAEMRFIKSGLLWLVGIPLPIILLLALYLHPG